jgi:plastocyanin
MRKLGIAVGSLCLLFAACGGSNPAKHPQLAAGGTVATTTTTLPSVATSAVPATTTTTALLTGAAGATSTSVAATTTTAAGPKAPCSPAGPALKVAASGLAFGTKCLAAPADQAFTIVFDNRDPGTPHNVAIYSADPVSHSDAKLLFRGDITTGPNTTTYQVGAQPAGTYFFHCDVHPTLMSGTFVVK